MLSCRSSPPNSTPYKRRLESADRIQEMMSHGRHAHLPPLPLIPYAIAMSLTVEYRALREHKRRFDKSYQFLETRIEILEALGTRWTTARGMAKLAKRALKFLMTTMRTKRIKHRPVGLNDVTEQARRNKEIHGVQSNSDITRPIERTPTSHQGNAGVVEQTVESHWPLEPDNPAQVPLYYTEDGNLQREQSNPISQDDMAQIYEWPTNGLYINQGAIPFCDFSNFDMVGTFSDPLMWGVSPNPTDGENSVGWDPTTRFEDSG